MTANPVEQVGGLAGTTNVSKSDLISWAKARVPQVLANVAEIQTTNLAGQLVVVLKTNGVTYLQDVADVTTPDDGLACIISADGKRFKIISSVPAPTTISLGGVYSLVPVSNHFVTGMDTSGNLLHAQPSVANLSEGYTGSGAVARATNAALSAPAITGGTHDAVTSLGIRSTGATKDLKLATAEALTADRMILLTVGDANRAVSLAGDVTLAGALTTVGAYGSTFTMSGTTTVTFPTTGTLATRAGAETLTNKSVDAANNTITNLTTAMFATNVVDTDGTLAANSDTRVASQKAIVSYVAARVAALDVMLFKGTIDCSANPNYPAADAGATYRVSVAGKIGGASGTVVEAGDILICTVDSTSAGTQAAVGANWDVIQVNIDGAVVGPASATSANIATFNGTSGKLIQDSGKALPTGTVVGTTDTQALTNKTYNGNTLTSGTGTLTFGSGKTLTVNSTLTLTGTDGSSVALGAGGTVAYVANKLSAFAATTSAELAGVISDETGSGALVFANNAAMTGGTHDALTSLGIRSTGAAFDLKFASSEVLTANHTISWVLGNADRTITLGGNPTINGGTHSGTNTGDQTITLTGDITGSGTGSFATTIGANKVTLGMMATVATATFLGRTTASTGNVEALTATQATALLNTVVGDSGSGGTKGLVPAPGAGDAAAGKVLGAGGTWITQTGGGGSGATADERQNVLIDRIYQSKMLGDIRKGVNLFATGFKASSDALRGINTGSSSNVDTSFAASNGKVSPSQTVPSTSYANAGGTGARTGSITVTASVPAIFGYGGSTATSLVDGSAAANTTNAYVTNGAPSFVDGNYFQFYFGSAKYIDEVKIYADRSLSNGSWKWQWSNDGTTWTDGNTFTWSSATQTQSVTGWPASGATYLRMTKVGSTTGTDASYEEFEFKIAAGSTTYNNMTLVTAAQTADATVSNGRVLIEFDNTAVPTLNTDLTVEVTCNGGTTWTAASLSAVTSYGQGGNKVAETVDQATTGGTSCAARVKTLNNKNIPIYGVTLSVH
jgi:hypothetical protein